MPSRASLLLALLLLCAGLPAAAAPLQDDRFNPNPAEDDFVLPMPGGLEMAFRKVVVPGTEFWGNAERNVPFGTDDGSIFEGRQTITIGGAFTAGGAPDWWYFLGKYEVSKGQFAAVMGDGDLAAGIAELAKRSGNPADKKLAGLSGDKLTAALAEPLSWVALRDIDEFVHRYNMWLFADPQRQARLPQMSWDAAGRERSIAGFVRLPTEAEWEYAARGGYDLLSRNKELFAASLPFPDSDAKKFAWIQDNANAKFKRIGRKDPVHGFYDMFGNVQELTLDPFRAEMGQGKTGGATARGGTILTSSAALRSANRAEVAYYAWNDAAGAVVEDRSATTGVRLAIGSVVLPDAEFQKKITDEYASYVETFRAAAPAGTSSASPIVRTRDVFVEARSTLERIGRASGRVEQRDLDALARQMGEIEVLLDTEIRRTCFDLIREATYIAAEYGRNLIRLQDLQAEVAKIKSLAAKSTEYQALLNKALRKEEGYRALVESSFHRYKDFARLIAAYGEVYFNDGFRQVEQLDDRALTMRERAAISLLKRHVQEAMVRGVDDNRWLAEISEVQGNPALPL